MVRSSGLGSIPACAVQQMQTDTSNPAKRNTLVYVRERARPPSAILAEYDEVKVGEGLDFLPAGFQSS